MMRVPNVESVRLRRRISLPWQHVVQQHTLRSAALPSAELDRS